MKKIGNKYTGFIKSFLGSSFFEGLLNDTDGNGLFHISDSESSQGRILRE